MKTKFLIFLTFIVTTNVWAQEKKQFFGVNVGLTYSTLRGGTSVELFKNVSKLNVCYGLTYEVFFRNNFGIGIATNYVNLGCDYKDLHGDGINDQYDGKVDLHTNLQYLNVPFSLKYALLNHKLIFRAGLYFSVLLKGKVEGSPKGYYTDLTYDEDLSKVMSGLDFGINYGVESNIPIHKNIYISVNVNFNNGLQPLKMITGKYCENEFVLLGLGVKYNIP